MMKFKPKKFDVWPITGWKEEITIDGVPKGRVGALIFTAENGEEFSAGGLTDEEKERLWEMKDEMLGKLCQVGYQTITSARQVPRFATVVKLFT